MKPCIAAVHVALQQSGACFFKLDARERGPARGGCAAAQRSSRGGIGWRAVDST